MASEKQRLFSNFLSLIVGFFSVRCISFIATLYITNHLGPERFGVLSSTLALATVFSVLINVGLDDYIVREIARVPADAATILGDAIVMKALMLPLALMAVGIMALANGEHGWIYLWIGLYSVVHSFQMVCCAIFRGLERMGFQTVIQVAQIILIALGTVAAVWSTDNLGLVAAAYLAATGMTLLLAWYLLRRNQIRPVFRWNPAVLKERLITALPFGLNFASILLFDRVTIVCIAVFAGNAAVGLFSSVYNITLILTILPQLVTTATLPLLVRKARDEAHVVSGITSMLVKYVLIAGMGAALALFIGADVIVRLFQDEYAPAAAILRVLVFSLPFLFVTVVLINVLEAVGQQRVCAATVGKALLVTMPLSVLATWRWGYLGATGAYVASHAILASMICGVIARRVGWNNMRQTILMPVLAGLVTALIIFVGKSWSPWLVMVAAGLGYAGALIVNGALGKRDLGFFLDAFRRKGFDSPATVPSPSDRDTP